jgi:ATP-dependent helicase/DNAse subunit B
MSATVHLLTGPAGAGKTAALLGLFRERTRSAPGTTLWLAPTRRAAEAVREHLLAGGGLCGHRLGTFADLVTEVLRANDPLARPLSEVQRRLLLEDLVAALQEAGQLSHFDRVCETRGFGEGLLALLVELQTAGVSPAAFARAAYRRGADGPVGRGIAGATIGLKDRQCARLYARYRRALHQQHLYDAEAREAQACALLRAGRRHPFADVRAVFVDGFNDFTRAQHELLSALAGWADELWLTLTDEPGDERAELFARPRATRQRLAGLGPFATVGPAVRAEPLPAGLAYLERQLFRPLRRVVPAEDADGVALVEAPGLLGEARLVARAIKKLLLGGAAADDVLVVLRDLSPYADLLREVFAEYAIPLDLEGSDPLTRNPAVAVLLRAQRLPEDDWPFPGVTALLRHTYFRPRWPEAGAGPEVPQRAEALLRLLGEPRGRDAYLAAAERWAERQQEGLEDEQAEESRRRRTHELAKECAPFLRRFFQAWDGAPPQGALDEHVAWLRHFADDLGVSRAAEEDGRDRAALACLWDEVERWGERERQRPGGHKLDRRTFQRRLAALANAAGLPRTPRGPGRVRVLSAPLARHLDSPFVFVLGLGERSFPRLAPVPSLLDEPDRQALQQAGLDLPGAGDALADEMLLFYQVVTRARRRLVLSYPAVDERGQELLPSSFLLAVRDCFREGALEVVRRRMLIEGHDRDEPLSAAEHRVRLAAGGHLGLARAAGLPADLAANLADAAELARRRFQEREHNPYDGLFRDPALIAQVTALFGPERILSPTALEDYVACPFRFFLKHVVKLEPLEDPREEIEVTRRGQAFHRALARLHSRLKQEGVHQPGPLVEGEVLREVGEAVAEDVHRAPSPASKELWRIEGLRLLRVAGRYPGHWQKFLEPWQKRGVAPRPHFFEIDFGLPVPEGQVPSPPLVLRAGDVEVRVSGRIDRVDLAELDDGVGFWIIDYKTGRASHYTSTDLAEFRRLQLTLYALAVEAVLLGDRPARPLGLAYWLVGEGGPKVALPGRNVTQWLEDTARWRKVREQLQEWVLTLVGHIRRGAFPLEPRSEHCTQTCSFGQVCRITQARGVDKAWHLPLPGMSAGGAEG